LLIIPFIMCHKPASSNTIYAQGRNQKKLSRVAEI
jgi:hypothetical protein